MCLIPEDLAAEIHAEGLRLEYLPVVACALSAPQIYNLKVRHPQ